VVFSVIVLLSSATQVTEARKGAARVAAGLERLIVPQRACPGQTDLGASAAVQERAMRCMTSFARRRAGKPVFAAVDLLARSAGRKSGDMLRCDEFDHGACGRDFDFWMQRVGYLRGGCWRAAENIAWGTGSLGSVRSIFRNWIHSAGHRRNILGPFEDLGVGLRVGALEGIGGAHVWTQHFGTRC
jgi:uncharacterized protein YkwD